MQPWVVLGRSNAPDGQPLELRQRGGEYLIRAGGKDLMSNEDEPSSRSLSELGCAHIGKNDAARVLVGGLGMGFTLRAALDCVGPKAVVEIAELVPAVVEWNQGVLGELAGHPLRDPRTQVVMGNVKKPIAAARGRYDAILLDVDNGPNALAHAANNGLYGHRGIAEAWEALRPGGVFGVWSFEDDDRFSDRLRKAGFAVKVHRVFGSRKGRGKEHVVWVAKRS